LNLPFLYLFRLNKDNIKQQGCGKNYADYSCCHWKDQIKESPTFGFYSELMRLRILSVILSIILCLFLFIQLQGKYSIIKEKNALAGMNSTGGGDTCSLTWEHLMDLKYQESLTAKANKHFGFRNTLIRLNNQVDFSLFGISSVKDILVGKNGVLYQMNYINSFQGKDYIGRPQISSKVDRLLKFQKMLALKDIYFILVFCPCKPRVMPEYLPGQLNLKRNNTNYDTYVEIIKDKGKELNFIDFNKYYQELKDTSVFTLYAKPGIHWSVFSSVMYGLDSLLGYMEHLSGEKYPRPHSRKIYWSDILVSPDDDLAELLNLAFPYPSGPVSYAEVEIDTAGTKKPDVLAIADSYYWEIYGFSKIQSIMNKHDFWVWNRLRYPASKYKGIRENDYEFLKKDILSHKFIILMITETNLPTLLDFDEKTYAMFDPDNPILKDLQKKRQARIDYYKHEILVNPKWSQAVRQKAIARKLTFEQMVQTDAEYMVESENNNKKNQ
jgi:hypothetical protein